MTTALRKPSAKQRILDTACQLFYRYGLRGVGIDRIIAESGVAKMSFYRAFPSKDDLIVAYLNARHEFWMNWFTHAVESRLKEGSGLEVVADALDEWFSQPSFRGCAFINAATENNTRSGRDWMISTAHKDELQQYLHKLAKQLHLTNPKRSAATAMIVIEGAIIRAYMSDHRNITLECKQLLRSIGRS